jgi:transcriptional regulator with XRE-family HTH domain
MALLEEPLDLVRAAAIQTARVRRGLTQQRLARVSGVSRKHISAAERGKNISCDVLKKLMAALELAEVEFDDGKRVRTARRGAMEPGAMVAAAEGLAALDQASRLIYEAVEKIQAALVSVEPNADLNAKASALIRHFTTHVRTRTADQLDEVEQVVVGMVSNPATAPRARGRRKSK